MCLQIFGLSILLILCAALGLENCFSTTSFQQESLRDDFPQHSLQQEQLVAAYWRMSFKQNSLSEDELEEKLCKSTLECFHQLDLVPSLSFTGFSQTRGRPQLQTACFSQLDLQMSLSFPLLVSNGFSNQLQAENFCRNRISTELQTRQVHSFQLSIQPLYLAQISGGVPRAFLQTALRRRTLIAAWTLMSLSLAEDNWNTTSSNKAWRTRSSRQRLTASTLISLSLALAAWLNPTGKKAWGRRSFQHKIFQKNFANISLAKTTFLPSFANNIHQNIYKKLDKNFAFNLFVRLHVQQLLLQFQLCNLSAWSLQWPSWTRYPELRSASGSHLH